MGRHSASYIAAQQELCNTPTAAGAAKYVGRVGALALALGVGAAMAGGGGLAHAEGTGDKDAGGGASAQSSPASAAATGKSADAPKDEPSGVAKHKPSSSGASSGASSEASSSVPTKQDPVGSAPTGSPDADDDGPATTEKDSETGPSTIPTQIPDVPGGVLGTNPPSDVTPAPQASPPAKNRSSDGPSNKDQSTTTGDADATSARAVTNTPATVLGSGDPALGVVPSSTAATARNKLLSVSPVTNTASPLAKGIATPAQAAPAQVASSVVDPITTIVTGFLNALGFAPTASSSTTPTGPIPLVLSVLQLISREIERIFAYQPPSTASFTSAEAYANANPVTASGVPSAADEAQTAYGDIGKWMLESDGQISNYGGQPYNGKELLESVNVIIVDPTSKSPAEATWKLNSAMFWAGFPAQPIHSTGFQGAIDDVIYGQQPTSLLSGFSNNFFLFNNDHGRIFGPDPTQISAPVPTSKGYAWSGAFSTETFTIYNSLPAHAYVSSDVARTALATQLILSGQATFVGMVPLDNAYNTETTTTGDHDGYAVVLQLK